jgi:hypothetical protein
VRAVQFCRSTNLVEMCSGSRRPAMTIGTVPMHRAGLAPLLLSIVSAQFIQHRTVDVRAERHFASAGTAGGGRF